MCISVVRGTDGVYYTKERILHQTNLVKDIIQDFRGLPSIIFAIKFAIKEIDFKPTPFYKISNHINTCSLTHSLIANTKPFVVSHLSMQLNLNPCTIWPVAQRSGHIWYTHATPVPLPLLQHLIRRHKFYLDTTRQKRVKLY